MIVVTLIELRRNISDNSINKDLKRLVIALSGRKTISTLIQSLNFSKKLEKVSHPNFALQNANFSQSQSPTRQGMMLDSN